MQKRFNTLLAPENRGGNLRPVSGASVTVTDPNGALATIYSDNGVTVAANPLTSNATGDYEYYAADGRYTETIVKAGRDTVTISDILLEDPADSPAPTSADMASTAANKGAGLVGFSALVEYAAGTVGAQLQLTRSELDFEKICPRPARSNTSALRWHGNAGGAIGALSDAVTYGIKIEAEADFDAVALMWVNYETAAMNNCKAVVAATETFATNSQDNRYRPMVGGVAYNSIRSASAAYGWDAATWSGAASVNIPAAGGAAAPQVVVSDFMPIASVPRADGGARPLLLIRAYHNGVTDGSYTYESRNYNASYNAATSHNRGRLIDTSSYAGDAVGTLSNLLVTNTRSFLLSPVFRYRHNVVTVANVGDSISAGTGSASGLDNWCRRACYDLSTPLAPVVPMNMGFSSQTSATYLAAAKVILATAKPTIAFYFPYSPNDSIGTSNRKVQDAMARCADFVEFCHANRIIPILATPVPNNNLTASEDALRAAISANVLAMGAANSVLTADFRSVTGDGATPERWVSGLNSDALHPSDAGHEAMSAVALAAINTALRN